MATADVLQALHDGLSERPAPQTVAAHLLQLPGEFLSHKVRSLVGQLQPLPDRSWFALSETFSTHPGVESAVLSAAECMRAVQVAAGREPLTDPDMSDPESLRAWVRAALVLLGFQVTDPQPARRTRKRGFGPAGARGDRLGHVDFRDRLSRDELASTMPGVPVRLYRRAVRAVLHVQQRTEVFAARRDLDVVTRFGKTRLAASIGFDAFAADVPTAMFVAYYTARLSMRTLFTSGPQARPMDKLAELLLNQALDSPTCRFDVLARVLTRQSGLRHLTPAQLEDLAVEYRRVLGTAARALERVWDPKRDRTQMVVRQGDDSTTWNLASRAFDQARTGLLNLQVAQPGTDVFGLEGNLPGKVPALVASDVAYWHASEGGDQHKDTLVWADLPLPWDVVLHGAGCSPRRVQEACRAHAVDPAVGWTAPYRQEFVEETEPARNLVHGVVVDDPEVMKFLNELGAFGGPSHAGTYGED